MGYTFITFPDELKCFFVFTPGAVFCFAAGVVPEEPRPPSSAVFTDNREGGVHQGREEFSSGSAAVWVPVRLPDALLSSWTVSPLLTRSCSRLGGGGGGGDLQSCARSPSHPHPQPAPHPPSSCPVMKRRYSNICTGRGIPACRRSRTICWLDN